MLGYTVKYSVTLIEEQLESGMLAKKKGTLSEGEIQNAISDLQVHYAHGTVSKGKYDYLMMKLLEIL